MGLGCSAALSITALDDWKTMRRTPASLAALRNAGAKPGTAASRKTDETTENAAGRLSGDDRSPATTSAPVGRPALLGSRVRARTERPAATSCSTMDRPTGAVAAVTRIILCLLDFQCELVNT